MKFILVIAAQLCASLAIAEDAWMPSEVHAISPLVGWLMRQVRRVVLRRP